ncbi:rho gtpase activator [Moniliophthora roreri]|nr:rho gtpase activator [Moniliophthora roreri]
MSRNDYYNSNSEGSQYNNNGDGLQANNNVLRYQAGSTDNSHHNIKGDRNTMTHKEGNNGVLAFTVIALIIILPIFGYYYIMIVNRYGQAYGVPLVFQGQGRIQGL